MSDAEFEEYTAARWSTLVTSAVLLGASVPEAEDLAQTTLMKVYVHWAKVAAADRRDAYVTRMLLNTFRSSRRRRWWSEAPTEHLPERPSPDSADDAVVADVAEAVELALGELSAAHREVVVLRFYLQLDEAEIAELLRVPRGTVKSRLSRALTRLSSDPDLSDIHLRRT